jgi:hypothetical protein
MSVLRLSRPGSAAFCGHADVLVRRTTSSRNRIHSDGFTDQQVCRYTRQVLVISGLRLLMRKDGADSDWLIDFHPDHPSVLFATGGSGHAYKVRNSISVVVHSAYLLAVLSYSWASCRGPP